VDTHTDETTFGLSLSLSLSIPPSLPLSPSLSLVWRHAVADMTARVWDIEAGKCTALLEGHVGAVRDVVMSPVERHTWCRD